MSVSAAREPVFAVLMRPCVDCQRQVLLADWNLQLGHCEPCALSRQFEAAAGSAHVMPQISAMRGAGVPTVPRSVESMTPQQRLAAGIPGKPAPREVILQLGEMERRRQRRQMVDRVLDFIGMIAAIASVALAVTAFGAWLLLP